MTEERIYEWLEKSGLFLGSDFNNKQAAIDKLKEIAKNQRRSDGKQDMRLQTSLFDSPNAVFKDESDTKLVTDITERNQELITNYISKLDRIDNPTDLIKIEEDFGQQENLTGNIAWEETTITEINEKLNSREIDIINDAYDKVFTQTKNLKDLKPLENIFRSSKAEEQKRIGHYNTTYHLIREASPSSSKITKSNISSIDIDRLDELRDDIESTSILTSTDKTQLLEEIEDRLERYNQIVESL